MPAIDPKMKSTGCNGIISNRMVWHGVVWYGIDAGDTDGMSMTTTARCNQQPGRRLLVSVMQKLEAGPSLPDSHLVQR